MNAVRNTMDYLSNVMAHKYIGLSFGNKLHYFTNKDTPDGKRLYCLGSPDGKNVKFINIYNGSMTIMLEFSNFSRSLDTANNNYHIDSIMDSVLSCFVCALTGNRKSFSYNFYKANQAPDKGKFKFQGIEITIGSEEVTVVLPEFDRVITGKYGKIPAEKDTNITWSIKNGVYVPFDDRYDDSY